MRHKHLEKTSRLEWVRLGNMRVSQEAQRRLNKNRVNKLVASFDPDKIGYPIVSYRDGYAYIIDGQHRFNALKTFIGDGWEDQGIECEVYEGKTEVDEAQEFDIRNDNLTVTAFDTFRIRVKGKFPEEVEVDRMVRSLELKISQVDGGISAVGTLMRAYRRDGPKPLRMALTLIREAYGDSGFEAKVIDGLSLFCNRYAAKMDEELVVDKLSRAHGGVKGLTNAAEVIRQRLGKPKAQCIAAAAVNIVNQGKGRNSLPGWFS